jgi:hypothetical protein
LLRLLVCTFPVLNYPTHCTTTLKLHHYPHSPRFALPELFMLCCLAFIQPDFLP